MLRMFWWNCSDRMKDQIEASSSSSSSSFFSRHLPDVHLRLPPQDDGGNSFGDCDNDDAEGWVHADDDGQTPRWSWWWW